MRIDDMAGLDRLARESESRRANGRPRMIFGLGTCGIAAGGLPLRDFARGYLLENGIGADVTSVGCIGMCHAEPLVDVKLPGRPRVTYGNVDEEKLRRIIGEHLVGGAPPVELAIGQLTSEMSECGHGMIDEPDAYDGIPTYGELPFFSKQRRIVLRNCGIVDPDDIAEYVARGGYRAAFTALHETSRGEIIEEMRQSGIRGRGGAGFSTGLKWELCARAPGDVKYLICNADEGDPGAYMDRAVLEGDPHSVIEGMVIAAYAMGATEGFIYIRAEYPLAIERLRTAIGQAEERGVLGEHVLGADLDFSISIRQGAGVFVCGEETALIRSIEGKRGEPRPRPPFPAASGLWGRPTNINNVETLANVAMIIQKGSSWFSSMGTPKSPGTKVFSLVGKIDRPGLIEVPMGIPMKDIIYDIGGGIPGGRRFKAVQTGGPSGGCIPAGNLDVPVDYENLQALGSIVGSGGMVVLDEDT
jgi:NADH-quinone oxidoreductase subunit F/NADP-reducing hydrogenase subunit HndC